MRTLLRRRQWSLGIDRYFVEWQAAINAGYSGEVVAELATRYGLAYQTSRKAERYATMTM